MVGGDRIFDDKAKTRLRHPRQDAAGPESRNDSVGSDPQLDDRLILSKSFSTEHKFYFRAAAKRLFMKFDSIWLPVYNAQITGMNELALGQTR
jgi:hypothetical protein